MSQPAPQPMGLDEFFAWQERQEDRYELVRGFPLRLMSGVTIRHDRIVVNLIVVLQRQLRRSGCNSFTGDSAIETFPGQIRRPDVGIDCGAPDLNDYKAAEPRLVIEVLSPSTRDFDTIEKLAEYKAVETLDSIIYIEPNQAEVIVWSRGEGRGWVRSSVEDLSAAVEIQPLGLRIPLAEIYEGITFPSGPRLAFHRQPEEGR